MTWWVYCFWMRYVLTLIFLHCEASTPDNNLQATDSSAISLDGDILLSRRQRELLLLPTKLTRRAVVKGLEEKWSDGVVPYEFSNTLGESAKDDIMAAMDQIMADIDSCVNFRPKQTSDSDYLYFFPGDGCYSFIGRQGGAQNISIGEYCNSKGVIMHEVIHALGRWHEQSRPDRDNYVIINTENIQQEFYDNFMIVINDETSTQGMEYDFDSIMHYDAYAFSSNRQPTIEPMDNKVALGRLGQRQKLSEIDKGHLRNLYCDMIQQSTTEEEKSQWSSWGSWSMCSASCGNGLQQRRRTCILVNKVPCVGETTEERKCTIDVCPTERALEWGEWSPWSGCSRTCGKGLRSRIRVCIQGNECTGSHIGMEECNVHKCQQAEWSSWSKWTFCSNTCGNGTRHRSRRCISDSDDPNDELHLCPGPSVESRHCFINVSCGLLPCNKQDKRDEEDRECESKVCSKYHCYNETCLAGFMFIGCYQLSVTGDLKPLVISSGTEDRPNNKTNLLRECGRITQFRTHSYFALGRNDHCYSDHLDNAAHFIQGGPSNECDFSEEVESTKQSGIRSSSTIEVYQIVDKEAFEFSVRAMDHCGDDFCRKNDDDDRDMHCSNTSYSSGSYSSTKYLTLTIIILILLHSLDYI